MKLTIRKATLVRIIWFLKWAKIAAKLTAIGTTVSGAITALFSSASTGIAIGAAGATTYAVSKGIPTGYEKTKHIPPGRVDRHANMLRLREIEYAFLKMDKAKDQKKKMQGGILSANQLSARSTTTMAGTSTAGLAVRKK